MSDVQVDTIDHFARVAMVARALTGRLDPDEIIGIVVHQGMAGLEAQGALFGVLDRDDVVIPVATTGSPSDTVHALGPIHLDRQLPLAVAARERTPVFIPNRHEAIERFPDLARSRSGAHAWAAIPALARGAVLGVLGVSFQREHSFSTTDRLFLEALVDVAAPALAASLGRPTQQPPVTDLRAIVVRVVSAATSFTHRIRAGSDGMPALTRAQAPPVTEVLDHLIANAVAHSLPGSVVDVRCAVVGPRIEITVDDQGSGLPPERHRSVLEPSEGIERGLVRCRRLARANGGDLSCTTSPDGGARFVLTLPNALVG